MIYVRAFVGDMANRLLDLQVLDLIPASYAVFLNPQISRAAIPAEPTNGSVQE